MSAYKSSIYDLLSMDNLAIPDYQRPYKWTKRNINELLTDISKAIEEGQKYGDSYKYRIGTILIHNSQDGKSYIVDGQQRILSIALVCLYLFPSFRSDLTNHCFTDDVSKQNIRDNYMFIQQWFTLQSDEEKNRFLEALKRIIEVIVITVNEESEAFQLFDSQNSRGKPLYPHDLLKAYHLREMTSSLSEMEHAVKKWEDEEPNEIKELFSDYIFPIYNWSKKTKTDTFSDRYIEVFKGADIKESYTYAMRAFKSSPFFQISEPFIAGNDFFEYVGHYIQMLRDIKKELEKNGDFSAIQEILSDRSSGLKYCKILFYCALLSYYDRFHCFDKMAVIRLFTWSFMIRIDMQHLGYDTINKYAIGEYNAQYSNNLPVFSLIANARKHADISNLTIECNYNKDNWSELSVKLLKLNGLYRNDK
ncbi:MAG: DUF262 domain-containing protein [Bacteroidales bacterium]|nr:DUF262 domain-containing protein [Bacteroidales bacterium]